MKMNRVCALAVLILLLASPSWAMEHYVNTVQDQQGNAIPGTRITVYQAGTTELASLYSGNSVDPKPNPFFNASNGTYDFYASNGAYDIQFHRSGTDFTTANVTYTGVVLYDPTDGAATLGLDGSFNVGPEIFGATSANPVIVGNGTQKLDLFGDPTMGGTIRPNPLGDSIWHVWPTFSGCVKDENSVALVFCFIPSGSTPKAKYPFQPGYYPLKSVWIGAGTLYGDGTNCPERPTAATINSGPKIPTFICTDNNASRLTGMLMMPNDWDGGTITLTHSYIQTAADTNALNGDVAAQCRGNGETVSSTWGTEVAIDDAAVTGSNKNDMTTSGDITPAGTCAPGDMLYFYYELDATGTTTAVATLHHLGFRLTYSSTSLSH